MMPYLVGAVGALSVGVYAHLFGLSRQRAFYATVLIVVATYYILFAAMAGSGSALLVESLIAAGFGVVATVGFRGSTWVVVAGLAAHGIMDSFHGSVVTNPGVPEWWPAFCGTYDVVAAVFLAVLIRRGATPRAA